MDGELYAQGRRAHPELVVCPEAFDRCLAAAVAHEPAPSPRGLPIGDLYLACGCIQRTPGAAVAFTARFQRTIRRAVARVLTNAAEREDAEQRTLDVLLVGGGQPKLGQYLGQGPLEHWVAVVAIRIAVSMGRAETAEIRLRQKAAADATGACSAELLLMKHELRAELEAAVGNALAGLSDRERLMLRLHLVSGMTLEAIGRSFDVTHSTVSRWLTHVRTRILEDVQRSLGERLKVANADLASFARLVMSDLDVSVSRLLGAA